MKKILAIAATALTLSTSVSAALIDNGTYTTDDVTGLEWLDLTQTTSMSFDDVNTQLASGGTLQNWRWATEDEISSFFDSAGGTGPYSSDPLPDNKPYGTYEEYNKVAAQTLLSLWGVTQATSPWPDTDPWSNFLIGEKPCGDDLVCVGTVRSGTFGGWLSNYVGTSPTTGRDYAKGSALVSTVPIPAAAWLFGSALIGLVGIGRKRHA